MSLELCERPGQNEGSWCEEESGSRYLDRRRRLWCICRECSQAPVVDVCVIAWLQRRIVASLTRTACMHAVSRPSPLTPTQSTEKRRSFAGPRCMSPPCSGYFRHRSAHASDDFRSQRTSASRRGDVAAKSTERYRRAMHEGNSKPGTERWMEIGDILERNVEYVVVFFCFFREGSSVRTQKWHYRQIPIFIVIPQISLEKTVTNTLPQDQISPIHCF